MYISIILEIHRLPVYRWWRSDYDAWSLSNLPHLLCLRSLFLPWRSTHGNAIHPIAGGDYKASLGIFDVWWKEEEKKRKTQRKLFWFNDAILHRSFQWQCSSDISAPHMSHSYYLWQHYICLRKKIHLTTKRLIFCVYFGK